jgi:hypothetical protein
MKESCFFPLRVAVTTRSPAPSLLRSMVVTAISPKRGGWKGERTAAFSLLKPLPRGGPRAYGKVGELPAELHRLTSRDLTRRDAVRETVAVEMRGTLHIEPWTIRLCPVPQGSKGWRFFQMVEVRIDGQVYPLDLGDRDDLWQAAETANGGAVVVTGTLHDGRVTASGISPAPQFYLLQPAK